MALKGYSFLFHFTNRWTKILLPKYRQNKIATKLFEKAEEYAKELGANRIILDTYKRFTSAIALYKKIGFYEIDNYLKYSPYSICMEKKI